MLLSFITRFQGPTEATSRQTKTKIFIRDSVSSRAEPNNNSNFKAPSLQTRFLLYLCLRTRLTLSKHTKHFSVYQTAFSKFTMTLRWILCAASDVLSEFLLLCFIRSARYGFLSSLAYFMPILHLRFRAHS